MNFRRVFDSVVTRLLLLGLFLVIAGTAVRHYVLTAFLHTNLSAVMESQQLSLATYIARDINDKILQRQSLLERLAASLPPGLLGKPARLQAWLKEHYQYQLLFSAGLFVVDNHGIALADYPVLPFRVNTNYADRDYIQAGLAGKSSVGRPAMGRAVKEPVLSIGAPIRNEKKEVKGVLVGVTTLAAPGFLNSFLQSRIGGTTGGFLLISPKDKLFVASSQPDMVLKPTPAPGINALHDRAMAGYRGTGITVNANGIEEVSAIASVPSTGWFVVARLPSSEAFATVERMKHLLINGAILSILVFAIAVPIGLYFVFRHLFRAAAHADRMTLGELPLAPLPVTRNDEVGHLISSFNRLLVKLNDKQAELARIAHHDELTGLPNRSLLYDRTHQLLARARRKETKVAVLFMDLDGFKDINDTLGHKAGDEILQEVANRFSRIVRQADTLSRMGGDEFVLVLADLANNAEELASAVAAKLIDALKVPFQIRGTSRIVGVSIGIAVGNGKGSPETLLHAADQALYEAKKAGRGRYVISRA
ncbi:MAG TPA: diguanylate cyclase [Burkholderiales bacterium]|nr:diguanylate cyclase [Burkholderiales bacterium]